MQSTNVWLIHEGSLKKPRVVHCLGIVCKGVSPPMHTQTHTHTHTHTHHFKIIPPFLRNPYPPTFLRACFRVSTPLKQNPLPFFANIPLKCANYSSFPFGNWFFLNPHKNWIFQWTPKIPKFFFLNPIPSFKVTKYS